MASPLLSIKELTVTVENQHLLKGIDLNLFPGIITGLAGHSGAGKSILARAALKLLPASFAVTTQRHFYQEPNFQLNLALASPAKLRYWYGAHVTMVFQNPSASLNPVMKVGEQIKECCVNRKTISKDEILEVLHQVRFSKPAAVYHKYPHQLSGGEVQRIMIAQAIISAAKLMIADEPTSALDTINKENFLQILKNLAENFGMAILLISHDMEGIQSVADNILLMKNGKLIENDRAEVKYQLNHQAKKTISPLLTIQNLKISYKESGLFTSNKITAIDNLSLEVQEGEILALIGESGSGKTSVLNAIAGLVAFQGSIWHNLPKYGIQILFQDAFSSLNPKMSVEEHLMELVKLSEKTEKGRESALANLLDAVNLSQNLRKRLPHELSGGQQQRLALARVISKKPKLILLDEPTSGLDHQTKADMQRLFLSLKKEFNFTYIIASHDISFVRYMASAVVILKEGEKIAEGSVNKLFSNPTDPYIHQLLFGINSHKAP